jgi:hypothetical protein
MRASALLNVMYNVVIVFLMKIFDHLFTLFYYKMPSL